MVVIIFLPLQYIIANNRNIIRYTKRKYVKEKRTFKARLHRRFLMKFLSRFPLWFLSRSRCNQLQFQCDLSSIWLEFLWNVIIVSRGFLSLHIHTSYKQRWSFLSYVQNLRRYHAEIPTKSHWNRSLFTRALWSYSVRATKIASKMGLRRQTSD